VIDRRDDPVGGGGTPEEWERLRSFALPYDGYAYFGGDNGVGPRLGAFANSIKDAFVVDPGLPNLDLRLGRWTNAMTTRADG
jgi:hypothetical protein